MEDKLERGQPRAFKTDKVFKEKFLQYIAYCKDNDQLANVAGFCVFCNMTRETFYKQQEYYSDTYKRIQEVLEDYTINAKINDTFKIFYMKNKFGYKDKTELDSNVNSNVNLNLSNLTNEQLEDLLKKAE
jgi:hypothetical protein